MADSALPRASGIYRIVCRETGRAYIGKAVDIRRRWGQHQVSLRLGNHRSPRLQHAWDKYGPGAFSCEVLELVEGQENLLLREQFHLDERKARTGDKGYNICEYAHGPLGVKRTPEARRRMSMAHKGKPLTESQRNALRGRKMPPLNERQRQALMDARHRSKGQPISQAQRAAYDRRKVTPPTEKQLAYWARKVGAPLSERQHAEYTSRRGRPPSEKAQAANRARRGRPWSDARRAAYEAQWGKKPPAQPPLWSD